MVAHHQLILHGSGWNGRGLHGKSPQKKQKQQYMGGQMYEAP